MFSKSVCMKNKQIFKNTLFPENIFTLKIEIQSNHTIDQFQLKQIEQHLNFLTVDCYKKDETNK